MDSIELTLFKKYNDSHTIVYFLKFGEITLHNTLNPVHGVYLDIGFESGRIKYVTLRNLLNNLDKIMYHFKMPKFRGYDQAIEDFGLYKDPFQVFYLKGEILDSVLDNYLRILDNRSISTAGSIKYSKIKNVIVRNRNNAPKTMFLDLFGINNCLQYQSK